MSIALPDARDTSSEEFTSIDVERVVEIDRRQERVAELLARHDLDALLLRRPDNIAWFTAGADVTRFGTGDGTADGTAAVLVTPEARLVATNDVDSPQLFEHELAGMGFQLKERPWHEDPSILIDDLTRGRRVGSDAGNGRTTRLTEEIAALRLPLGEFDARRMRELGRIAAHAVEATCRNFEPGRTELEVAGELSHRLVKYGAFPARLLVQGDGRGERYRHWTPQQFPVDRSAHVGVVARRWGLHVAVRRTVVFGRPDDRFVRAHHVGMLAQATAMHFAKADRRICDVWSRVERIYDKFGEPDAWRSADQAEFLGYAAREQSFLPDGEHPLRTGEALFWHPTVGPATCGDTILVHPEGSEILTPMHEWPKLVIEVKGQPLERPAILRRDP